MRKEFKKTPSEIAANWYKVDEIHYALQSRGTFHRGPYHIRVPTDVRSRAFAAWLTERYRLAMAKGIQLGREGAEEDAAEQDEKRAAMRSEIVKIAAACARFQHRHVDELEPEDLSQFGDYAVRLKRIYDQL